MPAMMGKSIHLSKLLRGQCRTDIGTTTVTETIVVTTAERSLLFPTHRPSAVGFTCIGQN